MLPTGTVTFLFTDIAGSTRLLGALGNDRYDAVLGTHRRLLREAFAQHEGHEVDTQGDSFFVAFGRALDAASAALAAQRALAAFLWTVEEPVKVRMGIHSTEAKPTGSGYVGMGVHRAARIASAAHGGQIVISRATRDLLEDDSGFACADLGDHVLKDFPQPQRLYQLLVPGLPQEFPPLRTRATTWATNLPSESTPLVGREVELAAIGALAGRKDVRVITLTGPGGTGKTRLALRAAADLAPGYPNGVFAVMLATLRERELVQPAIAQALGLREAMGQALTAYLAPKTMLLVLDNVEQIPDCAGVLAGLLASAPGVKLLATSREPLHLIGERVYPLKPLALPDRRAIDDPVELAHCPSVRLFIERARCIDPQFDLTAGNASAVAELCARLDGLPLAIELAAARVSLLSPEAMVKRLGSRLALLTGGARDAPARQQTLRNTLEWSHELLSSAERALFARLAIFTGGFTLEAVEGVVDADLETLGALVNRSLVRRVAERFTMLETIREFALERLEESGEVEALGERHAAHFEALAERCYARRWHHEREGLDQLDADHDNLRAAVNRLATRDPQRGLRLAGALGWFWHLRSHIAEGREKLAAALAASLSRDIVRARALAAAGELAAWAGDVANARPLIQEAVEIWREHGEDKEVACALVDLGWGSFFAGDSTGARALMQEGFALQEKTGDALLVNRARVGLCQVLVGLGELEPVERMARETMAVAERLGDARSEHFAHHFLADSALIRGDCAQAALRYRRALELAVDLGDRAETAGELQGLAMAAAGSHPRIALKLAGAAAAEFAALAIDISGLAFWTALLERYLGAAREQLDTNSANAAWEEGMRMRFEDAVAAALAVTPHPAL